MKAALYARVSTIAQGEEEKASIPEQIARIEEYCQKQDHEIVDRYVGNATPPSLSYTPAGIIAPHAGYVYSGAIAGAARSWLYSLGPAVYMAMYPEQATPDIPGWLTRL